MTNKEIFEQNMDELADAINEKAQTYGKKTVTEMTETVRNIHTGAVDSVNGRTGDVVLDKSDVNLSNVDNTSDADKPVSTATQTALDGKQDTLTAGAGVTIENNVISAEVGLKIEVVDELPETGNSSTIYLVPVESTEEEDAYDQYVYVDGHWESIGNTRVDLSGYVQKTTTIAGISLENNIVGSQLKAALELSNVDNTSDLNKPISTATQAALDEKLNNIKPIVLGVTQSSGTWSEIKFGSAVDAASSIVAQDSSTASSVFLNIRNNEFGHNFSVAYLYATANYSNHRGHAYVGNADVLALHLRSTEKIEFTKGNNSGYILDTFNTSANPTLAGTEAALTGLKLNDVVYKIPTFDPTTISGYDASKSQILTHDAQGVMTWVDGAAVQSGSEVTLP